jgi:hypothetical protein
VLENAAESPTHNDNLSRSQDEDKCKRPRSTGRPS